MAKKWQVSICTKHYPLFIVTMTAFLWVILLFGFVKLDSAKYMRRWRILQERYNTLKIGMTESELVKIMGQPQYKTIVHVNDVPFLADFFYVLPFHIELNNPTVMEYTYSVKNSLDYRSASYTVYLDDQCKLVVFVHPSLGRDWTWESVNSRLIPFCALVIIPGIVWFSVRLWCRKKVLKPRS